uniref:hypothetical protein n=1 Tax=Parerythrobacter lutipelagi TaxID=1964208 RepID=UPI0010F54ECB|nr:hypothetical protein [Parerythrobacter lutipelagi]
MDNEYVPQLSWEATFLDALAQLKNIKRSVAAAGVTTGAYYSRRNKSAAFASLCDTVLGRAGPGKSSKPARNTVDAPAPNQWKRAFLDALAETSNVTASANRARISTREVYKTRRDNEDFARDWHSALVEGYEHLEMDLLSRLRSGEPKDGPKFDNGAALRLLALHRDTMAQEHAQRRNMDAARARQIIDAKLEELRQKVIARREAEGQTIQ